MDALVRLNAVPGVIGSMACDAQGRVLAQAFPPTYDAARLQRAARALAERRAGLAAAVGKVGAIDMRFVNARIVAKTVGGVELLFLCAPTVNLQVLLMSAAGAAPFLEELAAAPAASAPRPPTGGQLFRLLQRIEERIASGGLDRFKVRGQIAFKSGLSLDLVDPESPDDPAQLQRLKAAASEVLDQPL